jgi:MFS family permease
MADVPVAGRTSGYNRLLLLVAGLGGLLYGVDVGIIGGALPYLQATSNLTDSQLSMVVAAVLLGSVLSTLFAGLLADWMGRKPLMLVCGVFFVLSIPVIALSQSFGALFAGRLLQGMSGGFIGVVVPLYLAECLPAKDRGRGTGLFQLMLTLGIFCAALIGIYFSYQVAETARVASPAVLRAVKDHAWRSIFWVSMPPGLLFVLGAVFVAESPRWLYKRGQHDLAFRSLLRSRSEEQAQIELDEMSGFAANRTDRAGAQVSGGSLLQRRYLQPFLLACVILFCNTATGINSVIGYNTDILLQSGLSDVRAHWGYVLFTLVNCLSTFIGMTLVDKRGRRYLLMMGTSGIIVSTVFVGGLFLRTEGLKRDVVHEVEIKEIGDKVPAFRFDADEARHLLGEEGATTGGPYSLSILYSYGGFTTSTKTVRSDDASADPVALSREAALPSSPVEAFFRDPLLNLTTARTAPLRIEHAYVSPVPSARHGWLVAIGLYAFALFFAMGPGVCVWLALSELMPTRIRSNGMSIALVINQLVSTTLAAIFLPVVGKYGYSTIFFVFTTFTVVYLLTVTLFLPETKGKTLEEIEAQFEA